MFNGILLLLYIRDANNDHLANFPTSTSRTMFWFKRDGWSNITAVYFLVWVHWSFGSCVPGNSCFHISIILRSSTQELRPHFQTDSSMFVKTFSMLNSHWERHSIPIRPDVWRICEWLLFQRSHLLIRKDAFLDWLSLVCVCEDGSDFVKAH